MLLPYQDPERASSERVADLMQRMTLHEKVGQMVQADGRKEAELQVSERRVGSFLHLLGEPTVQLQKLAAETGLGIPIMFGIDAIHGHGFWPGATVFPTQLALSCAWDPDLCDVMGRITAKEMAVTGLHWTFSPVLCMTRDLRWGRVGETFGEDPFLIGQLGAALVRGFQGERLSSPDSVLACAKHFAGYSETRGGRDATEADLSERRLRTEFLPPFRDAVKAGVRSFMTAYQCIDGVSCVANRWLLTDVLREEWGFDGMVVTDWDNVGRAHKFQKLYPSVEAAVPDSVAAGNDMIMVTPEFFQAALAGAQDGRIDPQQIELACRRILTQKFDLGLFDEKRYPAIERVPEVVGCEEHREPLLDAALRSMVLLKNNASRPEAPPLLPIGPDVKKIAVLGPNADCTLAQLGDWSFGSGQAGLDTGGHPRECVITFLEGVTDRAKQAGAEVTYCAGASVLDPETPELEKARDLAQAADLAVVVVGDVLELIGEECDRSDLDLSGGQDALLRAVVATGTPTVVVLLSSKPLCVGWAAEHAGALVQAFNPGMKGGAAFAKLLFGDENFSGKLTVSFARSLGEQPVNYQQIPGWHGSMHKNYDPSPLFPFGFGLSYTEFEYSEPRLKSTSLTAGQSLYVEVSIKNIGSRTGTEIAQLYINDRYTSVSTADKALKGYGRTTLAPGESEVLSFEVPFDELGLVAADRKWRVEPGEFEVMLGASSQDADLKRATFQVL